MEDKKAEKIQVLEKQLQSLKDDINEEKDKKDFDKKPREVLYTWKSPARVYVNWDKQKLYTVFLWLLVIIVLLLFIKEYLTIVVVVALGFVMYVMVRVPPNIIEHTITNKEIMWFDKDYPYKDLVNFWFSKRGDQSILNIDTNYKIPARLVLIVDEESQDKIKTILSEYLPYKEFKNRQSRFSKMIDGTYIPIQ